MELIRKTCLLLAILGFIAPTVFGQSSQNQTPEAPWSAQIEQIRQVARMIPGRRALRINALKFAESHRSKKFSVQGAADEPSIQARTVFQIVFPDGTVMIDSGMDEQVHRFFGRGTIEPYYADAAKQVERALLNARSIIITHEHGDHVAGVIRTEHLAEIAPKTLLTRAQVEGLETNPQMPEIKITPETASRYNVVDYDKYLPFGPGIALIRAPGHTPGSQMVYVALESGREYLFIADTAWHMDSVRLIKGKAAPWVKEDEPAILAQLKWLRGLSETEKKLYIVASHDEDERKDLIAKGVLGDGLE
ncbi:MAG TPA: MBL fold metallo-hydrolase [Terriglobales bacterium]|nr:MBL fold metallo-hydrolase [Terriglobales bacterium]HZR65170.1 MBL fold metallo-hydrolase [Terriglobales bacterium]